MSGESTFSSQIDDIDYSIIRQLTTDPRMSFSELGDRIGRSRATARERVRRMISHGMIDFSLAVRKDLLESFRIAVISIKLKPSNSFLSFEGCPRMLAAVGPDLNGDFTVMLLGESKKALKRCAEHLKERNANCVDSLSISFADLHAPFYVSLRALEQANHSEPGCFSKCEKCEHLQNGDCYGCPAKNAQFGSL
ncbi:MAG: Lrp/AsnC family transcriptional regulator [Candidatus Thorarchaeota archaeon]